MPPLQAKQVERSSGESYEDLVQKNKFDATGTPTVNNDGTQGYGVGSRWIDITADKEYVCLDASTGAAVWIETTIIEAAPGGVSLFYAYDAVGLIDISAGWTDITLDTEVKKGSAYTHAADSAEIEFVTAGTYKVTYYLSAQVTATVKPNDFQVKLQVHEGVSYADIPGSIGGDSVNVEDEGDVGNVSVTIIRDFSAGDKIKLIASRIQGAGTLVTLANAVGSVIYPPAGGAVPAAHKDTHKSGGSDAFAAADLLEAIVYRLRERGGPTDLRSH